MFYWISGHCRVLSKAGSPSRQELNLLARRSWLANRGHAQGSPKPLPPFQRAAGVLVSECGGERPFVDGEWLVCFGGDGLGVEVELGAHQDVGFLEHG